MDYELVAAVENNKYSVLSYNALFKRDIKQRDITKIRSIPKCDLLTYSPPCFTADTLINTRDGVKKIIDIKIGDECLTHQCRYKRVTNFFKQGTKRIYKIYGRGFDEIKTTMNHKFYVREVMHLHDDNIVIFHPKWVETIDLSSNYFMGVPINKDEHDDCQYNLNDWFSLGQNMFDITESIQGILSIPSSSLRAFMDGFIETNAMRYEDIYTITHCNKQFIYELAQCVAKAYRQPYSIQKLPNEDRYCISFRKNNNKKNNNKNNNIEYDELNSGFYKDGYLWLPIYKIERQDYKEYVYDIEVETDHSFCANGVIAHNCQDLSQLSMGCVSTERGRPKHGYLFYVRRLLEQQKEKPKFLVMESAKYLLDDKYIDSFLEWVLTLEDLGYTNYWKCINTKDYRLPQNRERLYMVSIRDDINTGFIFFSWRYKMLPLSRIIEQNPNESFFLKESHLKMIDDAPNNKFARDIIDYKCDNNIKIAYSPNSAQFIRTGFKEFSPSLSPRDEKDPKIVRITTKKRNITRRLTPLEYWRLQGFSHFAFKKAQQVNSNTQLYRQAGNASSITVLEVIFKQLKKTYPDDFKRHMRVVSLFSGIGSFEMALKKI